MWDWIKEFIINPVVDFFAGAFNLFFGGLVDLILSFIASCGLEVSIPNSVYGVLDELTRGIGYIIPVKALLPIPLFMITFYAIKLVFSIYQLIAGTVIQRIHIKG